MTRWPTIAALLLLPHTGRAGADAHGPPLLPDDGAPEAPLLGLDATPTEAHALGVGLEYVAAPVARVTRRGTEEVREVLLHHVFALDLAAAWSPGPRVALGASLPVFLRAGGTLGKGGPALGDLHLLGTFSLWQGEDAALAAAPVLRVPTGAADRLLGDAGFGAGLHVAGSWDRGPFGTHATVGLDARRLAWRELDGFPLLAASAGVSWAPVDDLAIHVEARGQSGADASGPPVEVLVGARGRRADGLWWRAGVARGVTSGAGAAALRLVAGVGFTPPAPPVIEVPVEEDPAAPVAVDPVPVRVRVQDQQGRAVSAAVGFEGARPVEAVRTDPFGAADARLLPGAWTVRVSAEGYGRQARGLSLEAGDAPVEVDVILLPEAGDAGLALVVTSPEGLPVEGARARLDGRPIGNTASAGTLRAAGLEPGPHRLEIVAEAFQPQEERLELATGQNDVGVGLRRVPGSVQVVVRGPDGPVTDAVVRFDGASRLPPQALGPTGERILQVRPGEWTVLVLSPSLGVQSRRVVVPEGRASLTVVEVTLQPSEGGPADLLVQATDPDGRPLAEVDVLLDGRRYGRTSSGGTVMLSDLGEGPRMLEVRSDPHAVQEPREVLLVPGLQEEVFTLDWLPGSVRVVARAPDAEVEDAVARFSGPGPSRALPLGSDGDLLARLAPGDWDLLVTSPSHGLQERDVRVPESGGSLVRAEVVFQEVEAGSADLLLTVRRPDGAPVAGADVLLDGEPVGATSTGGTVRLSDLEEGGRELIVRGPLVREVVREVDLVPGEQEVLLEPGWAPGALRVVVRTPDGPATDAVVRFAGPEVLPPLRVDERGERLVALTPGRWQALASSPRYGLTAREIVIWGEEAELPVLELLLEPVPIGLAQLLVRVVDPDGAPIPGATVALGEEVRGVTAPGGALLLAGLEPGPRVLSVDAPAFEVRGESVSLAEGSQERLVQLEWVPVPVRVTVSDTAGIPIRARVRAEGPADVRTVRADENGSALLELRPGTWQVVASSPRLGTRSETIALEAGDGERSVAFTLEQALVDVTAGGVVIHEQVHFDFDRATLRPESTGVLDEVAATILAHPEIVRVEVQGHTDAVGGAAYNLDLSERRARAVVEALVQRGVAPERLVARGYGPTRPLGSNATDEDRARNRRVAFTIEERSETP